MLTPERELMDARYAKCRSRREHGYGARCCDQSIQSVRVGAGCGDKRPGASGFHGPAGSGIYGGGTSCGTSDGAPDRTDTSASRRVHSGVGMSFPAFKARYFPEARLLVRSVGAHPTAWIGAGLLTVARVVAFT